MPDPYAILIVDDEISMRELLTILLTKSGYQTTCAASGEEALQILAEQPFDLLLCDIRLGDLNGLEVLRAAREKNSHMAAIMISAYTTTETAIEAMNLGAFDFVPKPFNNQELCQAIATALELKSLEAQQSVLADQVRDTCQFGMLVGNSQPMQQVYATIRQVAATRTNVLVTGPSGTGKELVARAIHSLSDRRDKPFVTINCGGIPETLMESELFGYRKGAFTGATHDQKGLFEVADKGTLFLDEIGDISIYLQVKLLRVIQERVFKPLGSNDNIKVDIRIISATNRNLEEEVIAGRFREDLFYRLNVIEIRVPPLRDRKGDLPLLAQHFLEKYARQMGKKIIKLSSYALDLLNKYDFPGNVRELENIIERSVALSNTNIILPESLTISAHKRRWIEGVKNRRFDLDDVAKGIDLDKILSEIETAYIEKALMFANKDKARAADMLGINLRSLRYRLDKLNIEN